MTALLKFTATANSERIDRNNRQEYRSAPHSTLK